MKRTGGGTRRHAEVSYEVARLNRTRASSLDVLRDDYLHGISSRRTLPSFARRPPTAPTRSAMWTNDPAPSTSTTRSAGLVLWSVPADHGAWWIAGASVLTAIQLLAAVRVS